MKRPLSLLILKQTYETNTSHHHLSRDDLLDELYYQVEIFTSQKATEKGITLEVWVGNRQRPEGEWIYAVDRKVELG